jgi:hypothetical protein
MSRMTFICFIHLILTYARHNLLFVAKPNIMPDSHLPILLSSVAALPVQKAFHATVGGVRRATGVVDNLLCLEIEL